MTEAVPEEAYETVIGLEVHVELSTRSKLFCGCSTAFGAEPNSQVCPVCLGLPGVLPVLNARAVAYAVTAALALGCRINERCKFDRKNYMYPDLPKGYQISQYDLPLAEGGLLELPLADGETRRIGIRRLHLEEDAGKSIHEGLGRASGVDFNRTGVPLIEIVTEPDLRSPAEAHAFLTALKRTIEYVGVSDVKMEEGSLRCDANISVHRRGSGTAGQITEIKNMNSFRSVRLALTYEARRHRRRLDAGERVTRETRHWDERQGVTFPSRSKEEAHDYRYFPEPDLVPLLVQAGEIDRLRAELPELPGAVIQRLEAAGLSPEDAGVIAASPALVRFFDATAERFAQPVAVSNWIRVDLLAYLNAQGLTPEERPITPDQLAGLLRLVEAGAINSSVAKEVFTRLCESDASAEAIVEAEGLRQIQDEDRLVTMVDEVVAEHPDAVASVRAGKDQAIGFLVGRIMRKSRGKANPQRVNQLLRERLVDGDDGGDTGG